MRVVKDRHGHDRQGSRGASTERGHGLRRVVGLEPFRLFDTRFDEPFFADEFATVAFPTIFEDRPVTAVVAVVVG